MEGPDGEDTDRQKPFKLSFVDKNLPGRSYVRINKPPNLPHVVTPKFYAKSWEENEQHEELVNKYLEKLKYFGPRERFEDPVTENQKYGWYQIRLTDANSRDRRLNFHKRTNIIVTEHLMNYTKIRE